MQLNYWKPAAKGYVLNSGNILFISRLLLGLGFIGAGLILISQRGRAWLWVLFGALQLLQAFLTRKQQIAIDTARQLFLAPKTGVGGAVHELPLAAFSHFKVEKVSYMRLPVAVEVYVYFADDRGGEVKTQLRQRMFTNNAQWAQVLIDETQALMDAVQAGGR